MRSQFVIRIDHAAAPAAVSSRIVASTIWGAFSWWAQSHGLPSRASPRSGTAAGGSPKLKVGVSGGPVVVLAGDGLVVTGDAYENAGGEARV